MGKHDSANFKMKRSDIRLRVFQTEKEAFNLVPHQLPATIRKDSGEF